MNAHERILKRTVEKLQRLLAINYTFEAKKTEEWPEGHKVIVFDIPITTRRTYKRMTRRVVSRAFSPVELKLTLDKIRDMGYKPVCVVRLKELKL